MTQHRRLAGPLVVRRRVHQLAVCEYPVEPSRPVQPRSTHGENLTGRDPITAMRFLLRLLATAAALWVAVFLVPGISYEGGGLGLLGVALVFGFVNAFIRPILKLLTCPLVVLTLGLFIFILNAFLLWLTAEIAQWLGLGFDVDGFIAALIGALIVGIVSTILNLFVGKNKKTKT